jgi:hypothetical protein
MKKIIQIILAIAIIVLAYFIVDGILRPIRFEKEKKIRYAKVINKLKDIRTAELAYKSVFGEFAGEFDTLINFVKTNSFPVIKQIGDIEDSLAVAHGEVTRDTVYISVLDSIFSPGYCIDSLKYVPFTDGIEFNLGVGEILTGSNVKVKVFEASVINDIFLKGLDEQLIINLNDKKAQFHNFPGLKVGSLIEATNNAGNWE